MNSIFCHISPTKLPFSSNFILDRYTFLDIPEYAKISFKQCEKYLNTKPVIIDDDYIHTYMMDEIVYFYNLCKSNFPSYQRDAFWFTTLLRLFIVYNYCKRFKINKFIHLEYDNLIYSDLKILSELPPSLYFTRVGPWSSSAGFLYCNSLTNFQSFITKLKQLILKGEGYVRQFTRSPNLSEMAMIDLIHTNTHNIIDYLPILPNGVGSDNFDSLKVVFDGASYGQHICGTNAGDTPGWYSLSHYVGTQLSNNSIKVNFNDKTPYLIYNNEHINILNLHVHSKQLHLYV